jgi:hypothetical protein
MTRYVYIYMFMSTYICMYMSVCMYVVCLRMFTGCPIRLFSISVGDCSGHSEWKMLFQYWYYSQWFRGNGHLKHSACAQQVTSHIYSELLQTELLTLLENFPLRTTFLIHYPHDGESLRFTRKVTWYLYEQFHGCWIGRGGTPIWSPCSPDLSPLD